MSCHDLVDDSWRYFGNGLMYAMEPWSGNYTVPPAIWTSAHVNQFVEPGWHFLGGEGSGLLPGGGSWTVMVPSPNASRTNSPKVQSLGARLVGDAGAGDFTLVLEKLEGDCLRTCSIGCPAQRSALSASPAVLLPVCVCDRWLCVRGDVVRGGRVQGACYYRRDCFVHADRGAQGHKLPEHVAHKRHDQLC